MKTLITGGAGFIGSHLARACLKLGDVRILDDLSSGRVENIEGLNVHFTQGCITDRKVVDECIRGVDLVVHLAAQVSVPESVLYPVECARRNVSGLLTVLDAAESAGVGRFVFASSAAVYGNNSVSPKHESMPPDPQSPYALTKWDGEFYCALYSRRGKMSAASARFFNVFGARQLPDSSYAAAVPRFILNALTNKPIQIFGDGAQTRDFVYVEDIVSGLIHLAVHPECCGVYNIGYGVSTSVLAIADKILSITNQNGKIVHGPERLGDVRHSTASIEKILATGWSPVGNIDDGLRKTIAWFRDCGRHPIGDVDVAS